MSSYVPDEGDLIWLDFDPQLGHEQAGRRPALVLSPSRFNRRTLLAFVCPVTNAAKGYSSEVPLPAGIAVTGVILCSHLRSVDWKQRNPQFIGRAPADILLQTREIVAEIAGIP